MTMGNFAPVVTTGLILFNIIVGVLISAFAMDDVAIGKTGSIYNPINNTGEGESGDISDPGMFARFVITIYSMPWWVNIFIIFANVILLPLTILAWARGL